MQYYMTYVLGYIAPSNQKADMGTITHKVLEILANLKKCQQEKKSTFEDDCIGHIDVPSDLLTPCPLTDDEIATFNKDVSAKTIYKYECFIQPNHVRYGRDLVDSIFARVYDYYMTKFTNHKWTGANRKQAYNMVWIALDYKNGIVDPRKRTIVEAEPHFELKLDEDWAAYDFDYLEDNVQGQIDLKGTIDLVTQIDDDTIEIIDWKTGQRLDWADKNTAKKDIRKLKEDTQLMLYYYAAKRMYPQYKNVFLTIMFIRDGGPFSMCFDDDTVKQIKEKIKKTKQEIESCKLPKMVSPTHQDFRCKTLCHFFKTKWPNTNTSVCDFIHNQIKHRGIEHVSQKLKSKNHTLGRYQNPGG